MTTSTSRISLAIPENTDSMADAPTLLSNNYDKIDNNCGCVLVSTLGSVSNPFNGMHVRNAADNKNYFRVNGAWVESNAASTGNTAFGGVTDTTTQVSFTTETKIAQVTFNAVAGRKYLIHTSIDLNISGTDNFDNIITQRIRYASGATVTTGGSLIHTKIFGYRDDAGPRHSIVEFFPNSTAQFTVGSFMLRTGTNSILASSDNCNSNVWVMDWGS